MGEGQTLTSLHNPSAMSTHLIDKALALVALRRQAKALEAQVKDRSAEFTNLMLEAKETQVRPDDTGVLITLIQTDSITYRDGGVTEAAKLVAKAESELKKAKALLKGRQAAAKAANKYKVDSTEHGIRVTGL